MSLFRKDFGVRLNELVKKAKQLELKIKDVDTFIELEKDLKEIEREDLEVLELVFELYRYGRINKSIGQRILVQARALLNRLKEIEQAARSGKLKAENINYIKSALNLLADFLEREEKYLALEPGAEARGYLRLIELAVRKKIMVDHAVLEIIGNQICYAGKPIQGVILHNDFVRVIAEHYTTSVFKTILRESELEFSISDPYSYVIESGKLLDKTAAEVQRVLGIKGKQVKARLGPFVTEAPIAKTWIKVERGRPAKFAAEGAVKISPRARGGRIEVFNYIA